MQGSCALILSTVVMTLAPGWRWMSSMMAGEACGLAALSPLAAVRLS